MGHGTPVEGFGWSRDGQSCAAHGEQGGGGGRGRRRRAPVKGSDNWGFSELHWARAERTSGSREAGEY